MHRGAKNSGVQKRGEADFVNTRRIYRSRTKFLGNRSPCDSPVHSSYGKGFPELSLFRQRAASHCGNGPIAQFVISSMIRLMV